MNGDATGRLNDARPSAVIRKNSIVPLANPEGSELTGIILLASSSYPFIRCLLLCSHFSSPCVRLSVHELTSSNHPSQLVSIDFFTVPTIRFQVLYVFLVLAHDRRRMTSLSIAVLLASRTRAPSFGRLFVSVVTLLAS